MEGVLGELVREMDASGKSRYGLAKLSGVPESALCRLHSGKRTLSVKNAEKLAAALGFELVLRRLPKNRNAR